MVLIGDGFWLLVNKVPSSSSMAEAITLRIMDNSTYSGPLGSGSTVGGLVGSCGWVPKKKILLRGFFILRHLNRSHRCR